MRVCPFVTFALDLSVLYSGAAHRSQAWVLWVSVCPPSPATAELPPIAPTPKLIKMCPREAGMSACESLI